MSNDVGMTDEGTRRFRTRDADAFGFTPGQLRSAGVRHPFHGVCVTGVAEPLTDASGELLRPPEGAHVEAALDYATRMDSAAFFSHVTAAVMWGMPLPPSLVTGQAVHIAVAAPARLPRGRGVRGHQVPPRLATIRVHPHWNVRLTCPATTWAMLGGMLRNPRDLVAAGDAAVRTWRVDRPLASPTDLGAAVLAGRRVGVPRLREALPLLRTRSASRPESWLRLELVDAGLPEPELNFEIRFAGELEASVDLAYPDAKVAVEYEGEHHLTDPEQWNRDIRRYERLAELGWLVVRVTKVELFDEPHLVVRRVRKALASR